VTARANVALGDHEIGMHQPITAITALVLALTGLSVPGASATAARVPVSIVHGSGRNGFDWGDAGIGAAAGAGITLLGLGVRSPSRNATPIRIAGPRGESWTGVAGLAGRARQAGLGVTRR
jgi:hypothetical protein